MITLFKGMDTRREKEQAGSYRGFNMCNGPLRLKLNELFTSDDNFRGTRGHSWKFRYTRDCFKYFSLINRWNQLDQRTVGASSINAFKGWLSKEKGNKNGLLHGLIRRSLGLPGAFPDTM